MCACDAPENKGWSLAQPSWRACADHSTNAALRAVVEVGPRALRGGLVWGGGLGGGWPPPRPPPPPRTPPPSSTATSPLSSALNPPPPRWPGCHPGSPSLFSSLASSPPSSSFSPAAGQRSHRLTPPSLDSAVGELLLVLVLELEGGAGLLELLELPQRAGVAPCGSFEKKINFSHSRIIFARLIFNHLIFINILHITNRRC